MYVARFSYNIKPTDRERALSLVHQEVRAARDQGMDARLLVPLTRPPGGAALQYEVVLADLGAFESFRDQGLGDEAATHVWMRDLSQILLEPPTVELLRIGEASDGGSSEGETQIGGQPRLA